MSVTRALLGIVEANRRGEHAGIYSICSAERFVLEAGIAQARRDESLVCIESTCNQVNQFGGYSGMTPRAFRDFVGSLAADQGLDRSRIVLGGDHLGPYVWREETAASAMAKSRDLVRDCVLAGYTKIHLDTSMRCADDPGDERAALDERVASERTVELARAAEAAHAELPEGASPPVYVIGTEVPIPGGELAGEAEVSVTSVEAVERTLTLAREAFERAGIAGAWERVIAVVVQPGVEFGDAAIVGYRRDRARELSAAVERHPHLVYEAHSTDHQTDEALRRMVEDHFAVLKVGPWLTFSMREALFALEAIERELLTGREDVEPSKLRKVLEEQMLAHPEHWRGYHVGDEGDLRLARAFSYSDRSRYYWARPELREAVARLVVNLSERPIPPTLLSQFLPRQYAAVRGEALSAHPVALVRHHVLETIDRYAAACGMGARGGT